MEWKAVSGHRNAGDFARRPCRGSLRMRSGNREVEGASRSRPARRPDSSAVRLDDRPGDVEPEPEAAGIRFLKLAETLKHAIQVAFGDSGPVVPDGDLKVVAKRRRLDGDLALHRAELDGVGKKIRNHLKHPVMIDGRLE